MAINWTNYKNLSPELQEEYNYRFKDDVVFPVRGVLILVMNLMLTIMLLLFTSYVVIKEPAMEQHKTTVAEIINVAVSITTVVGWIIVLFIIEYIIRVSIRIYQYEKWKKKNNITFVRGWVEWLK